MIDVVIVQLLDMVDILDLLHLSLMHQTPKSLSWLENVNNTMIMVVVQSTVLAVAGLFSACFSSPRKQRTNNNKKNEFSKLRIKFDKTRSTKPKKQPEKNKTKEETYNKIMYLF